MICKAKLYIALDTEICKVSNANIKPDLVIIF